VVEIKGEEGLGKLPEERLEERGDHVDIAPSGVFKLGPVVHGIGTALVHNLRQVGHGGVVPGNPVNAHYFQASLLNYGGADLDQVGNSLQIATTAVNISTWTCRTFFQWYTYGSSLWIWRRS